MIYFFFYVILLLDFSIVYIFKSYIVNMLLNKIKNKFELNWMNLWLIMLSAKNNVPCSKSGSKLNKKKLIFTLLGSALPWRLHPVWLCFHRTTRPRSRGNSGTASRRSQGPFWKWTLRSRRAPTGGCTVASDLQSIRLIKFSFARCIGGNKHMGTMAMGLL